MEESDYITLFITTASVTEAEQISKTLLERRKVACVNIISRVSSHFWWEDNIDSAEESLLITKTRSALLSDVINLVKGMHSYDIPEIIALPIVGGNEDYLQWIEKSTS